MICGGDEICVVETKAGRLSLKGSSIHPGRLPAAAQAKYSRLQKKERVQMAFKGVHIIENIFRTQKLIFGSVANWKCHSGKARLPDWDYRKNAALFLM